MDRAITHAQLAALTGGLGLLLFLTFGGLAMSVNLAAGMWITELMVFLGLAVLTVRSSGGDPIRDVRLLPFSAKLTGLGFLLGTANFFALVVPLQAAAQWVFPQWLIDSFDGSKIFEGQSRIELAVIILGVSLAAPFCEEYFFRGVILRGLLPPMVRAPGGLLLSAAIFSAFHFDPVGFVARAELGVLFGALFVTTGSLWPGIAAHAANNVVSTALFFALGGIDEDSTGRPDLRAVASIAALGVSAFVPLALAARKVIRSSTPPSAP